MPDLFPAFCTFLLGDDVEGNGAAGPNDPGGITKWAVARNRHPEISDERWAAWTKDDSIQIIRSGYWDMHRCGEMPWPWALCVCSGEVNQGSVIALAQRALGVRADGTVGPGTLSAMGHATDYHLAAFQRMRALAYVADTKFPDYKDGWFDRLFLETQAASRVP